MAERNHQPLDPNLMQELSRMFPNVSSRMIMETLVRHNNHREKCIEDLSLGCADHCNVSSENADRYAYSVRSQSVSAADNFNNNFSNNNYQYRVTSPQSAPATSGLVSPFQEIRLSYNNNPLGAAVYASPRFKPPVPPPTYRNTVRHDFPPQYPSLVYPSEQQYVASLIISPPRNAWNSPVIGRFPLDTTSQVHTWTRGNMSENPRIPNSGIPYQSQLHISISPEGDCVAASKSDKHTPTPTNDIYLPTPPTYNRWYQPPLPNNFLHSPQQFRPAVSPQTSPRFRHEGFHSSLVDMEDPEQRKIKHVPLKPALSPIPNQNFVWPGYPAREEAATNDTYTRALIEHQKQKLGVVQREVESVGNQREEALRDLMMLEMQYFKNQYNPKEHLYFTFQDLQNLRAEVRSLMTGCSNMTLLVDLIHKGQVPLGETGQEFYPSINTGQEGPVLVNRNSRPQSGPVRRQAQLPPSSPQPSADTAIEHSVARAATGAAAAVDDDDDGDPKWECCSCTYLNNSSLGMCEMCDMPKFVQAAV